MKLPVEVIPALSVSAETSFIVGGCNWIFLLSDRIFSLWAEIDEEIHRGRVRSEVARCLCGSGCRLESAFGGYRLLWAPEGQPALRRTGWPLNRKTPQNPDPTGYDDQGIPFGL